MKSTKCCKSYKINGNICPTCKNKTTMIENSDFELDNKLDEELYEELDEEFEEEEKDYLELPICSTCNGSGEGMWDGSRCSVCGGSGEQKPKIEE
ncbi:MAG: hypothetical protein ACOVNU_11605 [Candidatus Kapaibacteriota bacterium]